MGEWLESLVPWGASIIVWVQSFSSPLLVAIFSVVTFLGQTDIYLLLMPLVFWCVDKQVGISLGYLSLLSAWVNDLVKYIFRVPRPGTFDARIQAHEVQTNPSFPSGHSQGAMVNWGYLAYRFHSPVFRAVAVLIILSVGLSRIVLGVHFPQDVIGGWLIGLVLLVAYVWAEPPVGRWLRRQRTPVQVILAVGVPVLLIFLHPADMEGHYPAEGALGPMSALAGFGAGLLMERDRVRFRVDGDWWRRAARFLVGLAIVAVFYAGPRLFLPDKMVYGLEAALRFVRYAVVGWAVGFLCPWLFVRLRLAEQTVL